MTNTQNTICIETEPTMERSTRDRINATNTLPNSEQTHAAHQRMLRMTSATATEKRAHIASCASCATWKNKAVR